MAIFGVPILGLLNKLRRVAGHLHLTVPPTSCPCVPRLLSSSAGNAALHSIGPCPPVFPRFPLTSAPNRSQSVLSAESHLPVTHLKNSICRPFVFMVLRIAFSGNPLFSNTSALPPPSVPPNRFSGGQRRRLADHTYLSPSLSCNCGLLCSLCPPFRTPILCFQHIADSFGKIPGWGYSFDSSLGFNPVLRVLCTSGEEVHAESTLAGVGVAQWDCERGAAGTERPFLATDAQIHRGRLRGGQKKPHPREEQVAHTDRKRREPFRDDTAITFSAVLPGPVPLMGEQCSSSACK